MNYSTDPSKEEAAYVDTKTDKEDTERRIDHLKLVLQQAQVMDEDPDLTTVDPGDRVTVWDFADGRMRQFDLLGSEEVIGGSEGVSTESPVGKALQGKRVGDVIKVDVPDGHTRDTIHKIEPIPTQQGGKS